MNFRFCFTSSTVHIGYHRHRNHSRRGDVFVFVSHQAPFILDTTATAITPVGGMSSYNSYWHPTHCSPITPQILHSSQVPILAPLAKQHR